LARIWRGGEAGGGGGPRDAEAAGRKARECGRDDVVIVLKYENPEFELALNP
jgi:hypothetical protein